MAHGHVNQQGTCKGERDAHKASCDATHLKEVIFTDGDQRDVCSFILAVQGHFCNDGNGAGAAYALTRALLFTRLLCEQVTMQPARVRLPPGIQVPPNNQFTAR